MLTERATPAAASSLVEAGNVEFHGFVYSIVDYELILTLT